MHEQTVVNNRLTRMLMGILLPAVVQASIVVIYILITFDTDGYSGFTDFIQFVFLALLMGYMLVGLQSIVYAFLMEYVINPKLKNHVVVVLCSGLLGLLSGYSVVLVTGTPGDIAHWNVVSLLTGLIMGVILRRNYHYSTANPSR